MGHREKEVILILFSEVRRRKCDSFAINFELNTFDGPTSSRPAMYCIIDIVEVHTTAFSRKARTFLSIPFLASAAHMSSTHVDYFSLSCSFATL